METDENAYAYAYTYAYTYAPAPPTRSAALQRTRSPASTGTAAVHAASGATMRRTRKTKTAELLRLLNEGPATIDNPLYRKLHNLWMRTHVFPLIEALIPEARDMVDEYGNLRNDPAGT